MLSCSVSSSFSRPRRRLSRLLVLFCAGLIAAAVSGRAFADADTVLDVSIFPGGDAGLRIASCIAALPENMGTCDARALEGYQVLSALTIPSGVSVLLGSSYFNQIGPVVVQDGASLIGAGSSTANTGTVFAAAAGLSTTQIQAVQATGPTDWWHSGTIKGFLVRGNKAKQVVAADCVVVDQIGEASVVEDVVVTGCKGSAFRFNNNAAGSGHARALSAFGSDEYGFRLQDISGGLTLIGAGGDNNAQGTFGILGGGTGAITLIEPKTEAPVAGRNNSAIFLSGWGSKTLTLVGGTASASANPPPGDYITIAAWSSGYPTIVLTGVKIWNYLNLLNDWVNRVTIPLSDSNWRNLGRFTYGSQGRPLDVISNGNLTLLRSNLGVGTATPLSALHVAADSYAQFEKSTAGAPPVADCNAENKKGRFSIDTVNSRLYVCMGGAGWKATQLR